MMRALSMRDVLLPLLVFVSVCSASFAASDDERFQQILARYQERFAKDPTDSIPVADFIKECYASGLGDEAHAYHAQKVKEEPDNRMSWYGLGRCFLEARSYEEAVGPFERAASVDPTWYVPHRNLGYVFSELGQWDQAAEAFEAALTLKPDDVTSLRWLGAAYWELERYDAIINHVTRLVEIEPEAGDYYALGVSYLRLGKHEEAAAWLERVPKDSEWHASAEQEMLKIRPLSVGPWLLLVYSVSQLPELVVALFLVFLIRFARARRRRPT